MHLVSRFSPVLRLLAILCVVGVALSIPIFSYTSYGRGAQDGNRLYDELETIYLGNLARREHGVPPLRANVQLSQAARWFAWDSVENRLEPYCGHQDSRGFGPDDRAREYGYKGMAGAANAFCSYVSPADAIQGWLPSSGESSNLLCDCHREVGLGYYVGADRGYVAQMFGYDLAYPPVIIENEALLTSTPQVNLYIFGSTDAGDIMGMGSPVEMMISNDPSFAGATWEPYVAEKRWSLESGEGWRTVYVKTRDRLGRMVTVSDTIYLGTTLPRDELSDALMSSTYPEITFRGIDRSEWSQIQFSPGWVADDSQELFTLWWGNGVQVSDDAAVGGQAYRLFPGDGESFAWFSTTAFIKDVPMVAYFRLKTNDNTTNEEISRVSVSGGGIEYGPLRLRGTDFDAVDVYQEFAVPFTFHDNSQEPFLLLNVWRSGNADVFIDSVTIYTAFQPLNDTMTLTMPGENYRGQHFLLRYGDTEGNTSTIDATPVPIVTSKPTVLPTATPSPTGTPATPTAATEPSITPTATSTTTPTPTSTPGGPTAIPTEEPIKPQEPEYEPNDACSQANTITTNGWVQNQRFETATDTDWVAFEAREGTRYHLSVHPLLHSRADVSLELYNECQGVPDKSQNHAFAPGIRLTFEAERTGTVYLKLTNSADSSGDQATYQLSVRDLTAPSELGALILVAGKLKNNDELQPNIHNVTAEVYSLFKNQGFSDDQIYYMSTDLTMEGTDALATSDNLQAAITTWALDKVDENRPLTLYLVDHGAPNRLYLDLPRDEVITSQELNAWLTRLEAEHPGLELNVIIEACNSGSFIAPTTLAQGGQNRIIITSTSSDELAWASDDGALFSDHFLAALRQGENMYTSYELARTAVDASRLAQTPWLDGNSNGIPNEPRDTERAELRSFSYPGKTFSEEWEPYIADVQPPSSIDNGRGLIRATVLDDVSVEQVWAVVYPPSYTPPKAGDELQPVIPEELHTMRLTDQGNNIYGTTYPGFNEEGTYRVVVYAEDEDGMEARSVAIEVQVGNPPLLYLPYVQR